MIYISLSIGILIGALNIIPKRYLKYNDQFTFIGVLILLFIMGISIGIDRDIIKNLKTLGAQSLLFTFFTVGFSIVVVYSLTKLLLKEKQS